jgi:hypothetical protein
VTSPFRGRGPFVGRGPFMGRGPLAGKGPFGFNSGSWDIDLTGIAVRAAYSNPAAFGTTGAVTGWQLPGLSAARLSADSMTGPRLVRVQDGTYEWAPHNLLLNSATLSTQSLTVVVGQVLTIAATGTGTVTLSDAATGTLNASSARPSLTVTATTTTLTCTVAGTVTEAQVNRGAVALAYVPTAGAARYAPPVEHDGTAWGLRGEPAATNSIRNSTMLGAVAGIPGTLPTNWAAQNIGGINLTEVVGTGYEDGIAYVDVRFTGTTSTNSTGAILTEASTQIAALSGQVWASSLFVRLIGGSTANIASINNSILERDSGGVLLAATNTAIVITSAALSSQRVATTRTLNNASTAFVQQRIAIIPNAFPVAIDITFRIGWPQLETGSIATSPIPTFGAAVTRTIDAIDASTAARTKGLIVVDYVPREAGSQQVASIDDTTTNERHLLTNDGIYAVTDGGAAQASVDGGTPTVGALNRVAATWNTDRFAVSLNGGAAAADASGTVPTVNRIRIASGLNGGVRALRVGAQDVTDAALVSRARV